MLKCTVEITATIDIPNNPKNSAAKIYNNLRIDIPKDKCMLFETTNPERKLRAVNVITKTPTKPESIKFCPIIKPPIKTSVEDNVFSLERNPTK